MPESGFAVEVNVDPQGSELETAASLGATTLAIEDPSAYDPQMTVELNGQRLAVTAVDVDAKTIGVAPAITAAGDIGDRVLVVAGGEVSYDYSLTVHFDEGEPQDIPIVGIDRTTWQAGPLDPPVPVTVSDDLTTILDAPGRVPMISAEAVDKPLLIGALTSNLTIPTGSGYTTVTGWVISDSQGADQAITYDNTLGQFTVHKDGYYRLSDTAVKWDNDPSATGRRLIRPYFFSTVFGSFALGEFVGPGDTVRTTTPVVTPLKEMTAGESFRFEVSQTSGGNLAIIGDAAGISSFVCIEWCGPLLPNRLAP